MKWWKDYGMDSIHKEDWSAYEKEFPIYLDGVDKNGQPRKTIFPLINQILVISLNLLPISAQYSPSPLENGTSEKPWFKVDSKAWYGGSLNVGMKSTPKFESWIKPEKWMGRSGTLSSIWTSSTLTNTFVLSVSSYIRIGRGRMKHIIREGLTKSFWSIVS